MLPLLLHPDHVAHFAALHALKTRRTKASLRKAQQILTPHAKGQAVPLTDAGELRMAIKQGDGTAVLPVTAVIDYRPNWLCYYGYMVSSWLLRKEFAALMADDLVKRIVLDVDSPGGVYSGVPELAKDIFASRGIKPTIAVSNPCAASGALWIAAACEKFLVLGSGQAGSLGCLMLHSDYSQYFTNLGVTNTILRSPEGKADFNSIEPLSEASRAHHQAQIEAIAAEFTAAMAKFRGVSKKVAAEQFGQGRMLDAPEAVKAGLCDGLADSLDAVVGGKGASRKRAKLSPRLALAALRPGTGVPPAE